MLSIFLPVTALAAGILASPTLGQGRNSKRSFAATSVFESLDTPGARWVKERDFAGLSKDEQSIELRIQLAQQNMDKFHELATNVSQHRAFNLPNRYALSCGLAICELIK
jgi:hypothetical protein